MSNDYVKGDDFKEDPDKSMTYGISKGDHTNVIEVYSSAEVRDLIIRLLNYHEEVTS